jgi:hypothetical protein
LLERGFLAREDLLHPLIYTLEGVMRRVTNGPGPPGVGGLASHIGSFLAPSHLRVAKRKEQQFPATPPILDGK